jgi:hypothetical protein
VPTSDDDSIPFDSPPFSLRTQPQRPGELTELIDVPVEGTLAQRVRESAAGLPLELALYIAVEAERAVAEAVDVIAASRAEVIAFLDAAAANAVDRAPRHVLVRPLEQYAAALSRRLTDTEVPDAPLRARVPHHVAASWAHAAAAAGVRLDRWLADAVDRASADRTPWEAAAASSGRTLAEWVLLQAARCARSRSTSPQTTASG